MASNFGLRARAKQDLQEIIEYIAADNPKAALSFYDRFLRKFELLSSQPNLGVARPVLGDGIRMLVLGNYLILYRIADGSPEILRVLHGARDIGADDMRG